MNYNQALKDEVAKYVTTLFNNFQTPDLAYHNLHHTHCVVEHVLEIGANYSLSDELSFALFTAAWFHDTGHLFGESNGHELRSNLIMHNFLEKRSVDTTMIDLIGQSILSTKFPYHPQSVIAEILCDADSYHFGTKDFFVNDELVKRELIFRREAIPSNWYENVLALLQRHHFFTEYCKTLLEKGKQINIEIIKAGI